MTTYCEINHQDAIDNFLNSLNTDGNPYKNSIFADQIEPLFKDYAKTVSADSSRTFDREVLASTTSQVNIFLTDERLRVPNFAEAYPYLEQRLTTGPSVTTSEVQAIIDTTFLTYDTFGNYLNPYNTTVPTIMNTYYSPGVFSSSGAGGFCALMPNIFAAFGNIMNVFNDIIGFANDFNNVLSFIEDFSVAKLLDELKNYAMSIIDQIVKKIKDKISQITALFTDVANFRFNFDNVYSKMHEEKQKIDSMISDPSISTVKSAVEGAIAFAASLFESLKLEEIQFLIMRFCQLISGIENFFDDLTAPLEQIPQTFNNARSMLTVGGFSGAARALASGASRLSTAERQSARAAIEAIPATVVGGNGVTFGDEGIMVEGGISVRQRSYQITPITAEEIDIINREMTFQNVTSGSSSYVDLLLGESYSYDGQAIWTKVRPTEKVLLLRLSKRVGKLTLNSAFRSTYAQSKINPSVKASWHSSGQAFDIRMSSYTGKMNFETFKGYARSVGFGAVVAYNSLGFVHVDTGPIRNWG